MFSDSGLLSVVSSLPGFTINTDPYNGFIRNYIPLGFNCRDKMEEFDEANKLVKSIKKCLIATVVFSSMLIVVSLIIDLVFSAIFLPNSIPPFNHYGILIAHKSYGSYEAPPLGMRITCFILKYMNLLGYVISSGIAFTKS